MHTPGPWTVHFRHREPNVPSVKPYWFYAIEGAQDGAHEANAHLIAAAPTMLGALETALPILSGLCIQMSLDPDVLGYKSGGWAAKEKVRTAIEKARKGGTQSQE